MSAGLYGMMGQEMREGLAPKIRRGHAAVLRDGRIPAGRSYGYDPTPEQPGVHRINEEQAKYVRLILELYIAGWSPRKIAEELNSRGVSPPRGGPRDIAKMEKGLHAAERARSALLEKIAEELVSDDEAEPLLKKFRDQVATFKQEIALAGHAPDYVEIDVRGFRHHRANIADLQSILGESPKK